ncbi:nitrilase-related carbon-nitrogen hydrolase [Janibacter sp. UYMM211]|uniref:nitrilase-related carbon-nitrogen hydrolase n=1 Tax=Janibacter sp. UYMM211 TaxID=3156342 RepID=UPI003391E4B9
MAQQRGRRLRRRGRRPRQGAPLRRSRRDPGRGRRPPLRPGSVDGVPVATMVCYDVEFPEAVRAAALAGARAVLVPTANMEPYVAVNDVVVRSRAIENATPVVYANHCGSEGETRYVGASVVVGPDGAVLARGGPDGEELLVVDLPLRAANPPDGATYLADRRPEIYDAGGER